jgi:hypothetical protein
LVSLVGTYWYIYFNHEIRVIVIMIVVMYVQTHYTEKRIWNYSIRLLPIFGAETYL